MADPTPQPETCTVLAHQDLAVDAEVAVMPTVHAGPARTVCIGRPDLHRCEGDGKMDHPEGCHDHDGRDGKDCDDHHHDHDCHDRRPKKCRFAVRQVICVTVPLIFGATAEATVGAVECGIPKPGACPPVQ